MRRLVIVAALVGISGILAPTSPTDATAAPPCSDQVLVDWFADGRVDRTYELRCYEDAVAALPPDLRDYTDAEDVIGRALQRAARRQPSLASPSAAGPGSSSSRLALVVAGGGVAVALAAAGGIQWRRRSGRGPSRPR